MGFRRMPGGMRGGSISQHSIIEHRIRITEQEGENAMGAERAEGEIQILKPYHIQQPNRCVEMSSLSKGKWLFKAHNQ